MDNDENQIIPLSKYTDLSEQIDEDISPYDPAYPVKYLCNGLKKRLEESQRAASTIYRAILKEVPAAEQIHQATKKGVRYVVDTSDELLSKLESGELKLEITKAGKMTAQLKNGNKFGEKLPIKREAFRKGIDVNDMTNALQMKALQEQLQDVADQIALIDYSVKDVLQGQQNDRIGLYHSGLRLFLESQNTKDPDLKNALLVQALKTLSDSSYQLSETMKSDIAFLVNHEYESARGKRIEIINERIANIHKSFEFIHQASMLRAAIYCQRNEILAMTSVLEEYSHFIETTIANNAPQLAVLDPNDKGDDNGTWRNRANLRIDIADFSKQLSNPEKVIYLGMEA